jgi:hypothetical protein
MECVAIIIIGCIHSRPPRLAIILEPSLALAMLTVILEAGTITRG